MRLFVNYILKRKIFNLDDIKDTQTVDNLKKIIADVEGVSVEQQRLVFEGKEMTDGQPLSYYNIEQFSTVYLMRGLSGGKKMRLFVNNISKRKKFTLDDIKDTETVENVKKIIADAEIIPLESIRAISCVGCEKMKDDRMLFSYNLLQYNKFMISLVVYAPCVPPEHDRHRDRLKFANLARYYNVGKKICRKCYGRLSPNATRCRKAKCSRTDDIRWQKPLHMSEKIPPKPPIEIKLHR